MMKNRAVAVFAGALAAGLLFYVGIKSRKVDSPSGGAAARNSLPGEAEAKLILNATTLHREWVNLPVGKSGMRVFIVYPYRSDSAPAVVVTAKQESASAWLRAMAIRAAEAGFIALVPDLLSGLAPNGGDSDSFTGPSAIAAALKQISPKDVAQRIEDTRRYGIALPAASGQSASLQFDTEGGRIFALVEKPLAGERAGDFSLSTKGWPQAISFLTVQTGNRPVPGVNANIPEDHSMHVGMAMAQTPPQAQAGGRGYPVGKRPDLPAGIFTARTTLLNSKLHKEFVDIAYGDGKLHTWVEYPEGEGKAPIVIVMQHGPGMDDWQRALADQLAQQGFIAIAADLHSGLGPNGGNFDSFQGTDEVMRAAARLTQDEMQRRYKAALEWGKKLPRWNGKVASIGFCMGGGNSFRFAGEVPELNAAVSFYGGTPSEEIMAKIKAPVLAFYGEDDARVTAAAEPTKASMQKFGKSFEYYIYPHATHGFLEYQDLAGNPAATAESWSRTIEFLKKHTM
jgi:carboxymethylenebutenolidase